MPDATSSPPEPAYIASRGFGPFVTERIVQHADGTLERWQSRRARKHSDRAPGSTWWSPGEAGWWMAVLFAVGSSCFAVAAVPTLASAVGARTDDLVYFVGSLFFTTAALLQYGEVVGTVEPGRPVPTGPRRLLAFQPHRIDWLAAVVQVLGTLFFNVSTAHALTMSFSDPAAANRAVWRPDAFGSICFLVSSYLAFAEVCHGAGRWQPGDLSWWITVGNLAGSVAFGMSAVASHVVPTGELRNATWTTLGTFVGGICFLGASVLLLPERTRPADTAAHVPPGP